MINDFENWTTLDLQFQLNPATQSLVFPNPGSRSKHEGKLPRNPYGRKELEYCKFKGINVSPVSGVYAIFLKESSKPIYIGRASNLKTRWSKKDYGSISPRNCFIGGRTTNCKVNNYILVNHEQLIIKYYETADYVSKERELIRQYQPELNKQLY